METERSEADGEEFSGFISGEIGFYGSYTDLIIRQRGKRTSGKKGFKEAGKSSLPQEENSGSLIKMSLHLRTCLNSDNE